MLAQFLQFLFSGVTVGATYALAAPVFNFKNEITIGMLVVGVKGMFDMSADGPVVGALKTAAAALSLRLGYTPEK